MNSEKFAMKLAIFNIRCKNRSIDMGTITFAIASKYGIVSRVVFYQGYIEGLWHINGNLYNR